MRIVDALPNLTLGTDKVCLTRMLRQWILLENVSGLLTTKMRAMWQFIREDCVARVCFKRWWKELAQRGFRLRWTTVTGLNVGVQARRLRCIAIHSNPFQAISATRCNPFQTISDVKSIGIANHFKPSQSIAALEAFSKPLKSAKFRNLGGGGVEGGVPGQVFSQVLLRQTSPESGFNYFKTGSELN